ncbi:unnamed protein product [Medioppia subpectinata]|uniref:non-specific serine/threonine protein kinase n=1 Tax=Medioppia subpectinata TaxID=1979941 RepID=A0A7R9KMP4_9ACAR|nr:unnamed protein product [Medioppia subpectinata]CAG2106090.1 unnamed protein product [Medioppia subpectinata]
MVNNNLTTNIVVNHNGEQELELVDNTFNTNTESIPSPLLQPNPLLTDDTNNSFADYNNELNKNYYHEQFEELEKIGRGGFGTVYKVMHKLDGNVYAIKVISLIKTSDEHKYRVLNEVKSLATVRSQYVVQYYNSWLDDYSNQLYIQMEFCPQSLRSLLKDKGLAFGRQSAEPMNVYEYYISCEIFKELLQCVQYLHELSPQIIHRDLNPDNVLIVYNTNAENNCFIKLCDFGLATLHNPDKHYRTKYKHTCDVGTLRYEAPEVANKKYGHKSDVYSLALIGGEIFDLELYERTLNTYPSDHMLKAWVVCLHRMLQSMMSFPIWDDRPECRQVLAKYNEWSIEKTYVVENKDFNKCELKDSFARFGDDLCELLLSYLTASEKFSCECVCKQWQRLVFNSITKLVVGVTGSWVSQETRPVNMTALEVALRKCVFISTIEVNHISNTDREVVFQLIVNCPKLDFLDMNRLRQTTNTFEGLSENQIKHLSIDYTILRQKSYVKELAKIINKYMNCLQSLKVTAFGGKQMVTPDTIESFDDSIVTTFSRYIHCLINLKQLVINSTITLEDNVTNPLREMCEKCSNIEILVLNIRCKNTGSVDQLFLAINSLKKLKGLTISIYGRHLDNNELMIRSQQLADCRQLRRLTMRFVSLNREFSGQFFVDIGQHLPRLQHLNINDIDLRDSHTVPALSQLSHLRSINMNSMIRFTDQEMWTFVRQMCCVTTVCHNQIRHRLRKNVKRSNGDRGNPYESRKKIKTDQRAEPLISTSGPSGNGIVVNVGEIAIQNPHSISWYKCVAKIPMRRAIGQIVAKYARVVSLNAVIRSVHTDCIKMLCQKCGPDCQFLTIHSLNKLQITRSEARLVAKKCPELRELHVTAHGMITIDELDIELLLRRLPSIVSFKLNAPIAGQYCGDVFVRMNTGVKAIETSGDLFNARAICQLGLKGANKLRELAISRFDPNCMDKIVVCFKQIRVLTIDVRSGVVDRHQEFDLQPLFESISRLADLKELSLTLSDNCSDIDYLTVEGLRECRKLKALNITNGDLEEDCVYSIAKNIPKLRKLSLNWCEFLVEESDTLMACLVWIKDMRRLSELSLKGNEEVTDSEFEWLITNCRKINRIDVSDTDQITADAICQCIDVCRQQPNRSIEAVFSHNLKTSVDELNLTIF